jgi:hypothetical protein
MGTNVIQLFNTVGPIQFFVVLIILVLLVMSFVPKKQQSKGQQSTTNSAPSDNTITIDNTQNKGE